MSHTIETVQGIYQAFGRGDVAAILATLSPQVEWEGWQQPSSLQEAGHPLFARRTGPAQVQDFFAEVGRNEEIHDFQVLDIFGSGRQVAAEVLIESTWRPSGQKVRDEEIHLWTFGEDGRITRFRHYVDTARHLRASGLAKG